ncbi:MAG: hypothetical protein JEY71_04245 [Sphaerochaeta sp.]|nr:hypothetical protein [Sphaerochaeta sp.]
MKGINTPGQALERGGVASFSEPRGSRISPCFPGTRSVMRTDQEEGALSSIDTPSFLFQNPLCVLTDLPDCNDLPEKAGKHVQLVYVLLASLLFLEAEEPGNAILS